MLLLQVSSAEHNDVKVRTMYIVQWTEKLTVCIFHPVILTLQTTWKQSVSLPNTPPLNLVHPSFHKFGPNASSRIEGFFYMFSQCLGNVVIKIYLRGQPTMVLSWANGTDAGTPLSQRWVTYRICWDFIHVQAQPETVIHCHHRWE